MNGIGAQTRTLNILIPAHNSVQIAGKISRSVQPVLKILTSTVVQKLVKQNAKGKLRPGGNPRKSRM